jgi:hypothetical protein
VLTNGSSDTKYAISVQQHEPNNGTIKKYIQNMLEWRASVGSDSEESSEESDDATSSSADET